MIRKAYLEITNVCNLSCTFCHKTARPPRTMTEAEFDALTDRLAGIRHLYFHLMGEPTLHPLLPRFIEIAKAKGFLPMLTTNGSLLSQKGDLLLKTLPHKISISLHAPAANPAFADPAYLSTAIDFARRAAEGGCIVALRLWNLGSAEEAENAPILEKLHAAFPGQWAPVRRGNGFVLAEKLFLEWGEQFDWPDPAAPALPEGAELFCHGLRDQIGVLCDGTVVPCCLDADGNLALGNLFETELCEILASPRARAIYDGFTRRRGAEELCRRCGYARRFVKGEG
ncbi:MAG: SPASM domain-containing protein [Clostridia bacterium]|nr:SPASM domain-containing protein [Clostridia bacterium]